MAADFPKVLIIDFARLKANTSAEPPPIHKAIIVNKLAPPIIASMTLRAAYTLIPSIPVIFGIPIPMSTSVADMFANARPKFFKV